MRKIEMQLNLIALLFSTSLIGILLVIAGILTPFSLIDAAAILLRVGIVIVGIILVISSAYGFKNLRKLEFG